MNIWAQFPLVRLIIPFIAGIVAAIYLPYQFNYLPLLIYILSIIFAILVLFKKLNFSFKTSWVYGILIFITLFISAYQFTILKTEKFSSIHFSNYIYSDSTQFVFAKLSDPIIEKPKSVKAVMEIMAIKKGNKWINTTGKAMVYLSKNEESLKLKYGDELILNANFKSTPSPQNPGEFDYKKFLSFHNIYHQTYLKDGEWLKTGINSGYRIYIAANNLQRKLIAILTENKLKGDEFAVGAALLLGYVDKLDADIIQAFASTGALHVLSVSGLHVAIIYVVLNWLLFFFDKIKYGNLFKALILLTFIWFYAMLTGLSPAVLRSAAMLSLIIIAKAKNHNTNIYNTLAASAFLLFLYNPYLIMDVGFQLSYLAVAGIVFLQPKIYEWIITEKWPWLFDKIWELTAVSLAAQLATFPLGLHYFHQFPIYFLLSNFIVIPLSTLIMYLGISVFSFAKIPLIIKYFALAFNWCIWLLNFFVKKIEKFPHSTLQGISISVFETWVIYGVIILFIYYFIKRKITYLFVSLTLSIVFLVSLSTEQFKEFHQRKIIVYNIPKTLAIDFIDSKRNIFFTDSALANNESALLFHVKHNWWNSGINETKVVCDSFKSATLLIKANYIRYFNKTIVIIDNNNSKFMTDKLNMNRMEIDYLIISKNQKLKIINILKLYNPKIIVFDSSNSIYHLRKWEEECRTVHQKYYSITDSGAMIAELL